MNDETPIAIDAPRLETWIQTLGAIGRDEQGLFRPVYSPQWQAARDQIEIWMRECGLSTRIDAVGNLIGRLDGRNDGPVVLTGSHIDTVRNGGAYDGALGVLAGVAALDAVRRQLGRPAQPIEVVALCEEEASRFAKSYWGSRAICGKVDADEPESLVDESGVTIAAAMSAVGLDAQRIGSAARHDIATFVELHIEQGRIMEDAGYPMGVVASITGIRQLNVRFRGRQDHAGTTPMDLRRDALAGAAEAIFRIEQLAKTMGRPAVATVGKISVTPGSINVVPGEAQFTLDLRHANPNMGVKLAGDVQSALDDVAKARNLDVEVTVLNEHPPTPLSGDVGEIIKRAAAHEGVSAHRMVSGAGHDSQVFAPNLPTAMIFTPSKDGISHSPLEFTPIDQIVPCVRVLARSLWLLANADAATTGSASPIGSNH